MRLQSGSFTNGRPSGIFPIILDEDGFLVDVGHYHGSSRARAKKEGLKLLSAVKLRSGSQPQSSPLPKGNPSKSALGKKESVE
jgi:hypothetical protein